VPGANVQIDWSRVIAFIQARDPALAAALIGVPRSQIDALQAQYRIRLPEVYVDFLETMGEDSGDLTPFGRTQVHRFSELMARLPPQDYPADRFFKVAFESDEMALAYFDTYLDLRRTEGGDCEIVRLESPVETIPADLPEETLTLAERLMEYFFWTLDVARRPYGARIFVLGDDPWNGVAIKEDAAARVAGAGFVPALPAVRRVACLTRGATSVLITDSDTSELVDIRIGGADLEDVEKLTRQLLASIPRADLENPPAERFVESDVEPESP
jgi:hypothetical protein